MGVKERNPKSEARAALAEKIKYRDAVRARLARAQDALKQKRDEYWALRQKQEALEASLSDVGDAERA